MDRIKHSISPNDLYARLGSEAAPIVIDVRRDADLPAPPRLWPMRFIALRMPSNSVELICQAAARSSRAVGA
jgi:rhodanese-related sulfurtransferase